VRSATQSVHLVAASVGFTSFALLWLSVLWGTTLRMGWGLTRIRHHTVYGIHQMLTSLGLTLGVVHALAQLAAPGGHVTWLSEVVPFVDGKDPIGVGLATISTEMFIALALSVLIQKRLGYSRWRRMHAWAYVAFTMVGAHALISGSDMGPVWVWGPVAAAWGSTVIARLAVTRWMTAIPRAATNKITTRLRGREVAVNVDPNRCVRFGFCEQEAPEVFRLRGDGRLTYRPSVPADDAEAVIRAAQVCPARAVVLSRLATSMVMPAGSGARTLEPEAEPAGGPRRRRVN